MTKPLFRASRRRQALGDLLLGGPAWRDEAACTETDPEAFFPERGGLASETRTIKKICRGCAARPDCLIWALDLREPFGVWGGFSEAERRPLSKELNRRMRDHPGADRAAVMAEIANRAIVKRDRVEADAKRESDRRRIEREKRRSEVRDRTAKVRRARRRAELSGELPAAA